MKTLILAAGRGSRLGTGIPKILTEICGKTILHRHADALSKIGVSPGDTTVVTGFRSTDTECACRGLGVNCLVNPGWDAPGNYSSFSVFPRSDQDLLILHGDLLWEAGLAGCALDTPGDIVVPVDPRNRSDLEAMKAEVRGDRIIHLSKMLPVSRSAGESMGIFLVRCHSALLRLSGKLRENHKANFDDAVNITAGTLDIMALITERFMWEEIDTPQDMSEASRKFS